MKKGDIKRRWEMMDYMHPIRVTRPNLYEPPREKERTIRYSDDEDFLYGELEGVCGDFCELGRVFIDY